MDSIESRELPTSPGRGGPCRTFVAGSILSSSAQEPQDAGRPPRADVPRAVAVAARHREERMDHVGDVDEIPPLPAGAVYQYGFASLEPVREDGDHPAFEV